MSNFSFFNHASSGIKKAHISGYARAVFFLILNYHKTILQDNTSDDQNQLYQPFLRILLFILPLHHMS